MNGWRIVFAQSTDLPSVPAEILKWVLIIILAIVFTGAIVYGAIKSGQRPVQNKLEDDPPIRVQKAAKRFNHELAEERHAEVTRRLDQHEREIKEIQASRATALEKINRRFERVLIGLSSIAARVGARIPKEENENEND